ncbi:MAG: DUF5121 domain-containing protein [Muribaculaceae bacterium]|nr:DUF5121 domain-containing protein [Muribaculaceae bacterium]
MKYLKSIAMILALGGLMVSCKDDDVKNPGNPVMDITGYAGSAYFGDILHLDVKASDSSVPLSTIHAELYFDSELVGEQVIRTKESGATYPVDIEIPYIANIPDGQATLRLTLQNINFTITEEILGVDVSHADYPYLTLVADDGNEYRMERVSMYNYEVTESFPGQMPAMIVAPAAEGATREVTWGYEGGEITVNGQKSIPFTNGSAGTYTISFNTFTMEGAPFTELTINDMLLSQVDDNIFEVDIPSLAKGDALNFSGFPNFDQWWLNPDFFQDNNDGTYSFMAYDGDYRFIADTGKQYIKVVKLVGGVPGTLSQDGTGLPWILGDGIGYPKLSNAPGWNPGAGIPMAPQSDYVYQVTVVGGLNIDVKSINFKFFGQDGWGTELTGTMLTSETNLIGVGDGDTHDNGNLYLNDGVELEANTIYVITLDCTNGIDNAILKAEVAGENEFEEKPVSLNGTEMNTTDNSTYSLVVSLNQGETLTFTGDVNVSDLYIDPDYYTVSGDILTFIPVSGYYNVVVNKEKGYIGAYRCNENGSAMSLQDDGTGAIWIIGEGFGNPSLQYQIGWTPENGYCMPEVSPKVFRVTATAGEALSSTPGQRIQNDAINFKFFYINAWDNGEFGANNLLTETGTASDYISVGQSDGNISLAAGVALEVGATYQFTIDLTAGVESGTIDVVKL